MDYEKKLTEARKHYLDYKKTLDSIEDKNSTAAIMLTGSISSLELLFPELKESEDERIINRIKKAVEEYWSDEPLDEILAWLEKQGEHAKFRDSIQVGDKVTRNQDGVLVNLSQLKRVAKRDEKQGEQKPITSLDMEPEVLDKVVNDCIFGNEKSAWSEEDEKVLHAIRNALDYEKPRNYLKSRDFEFTDILDWLKSLKERYTWKPSEEQLECLKNN